MKYGPAQGYITLPQQVEDPGAVVQHSAFTYDALSQQLVRLFQQLGHLCTELGGLVSDVVYLYIKGTD